MKLRMAVAALAVSALALTASACGGDATSSAPAAQAQSAAPTPSTSESMDMPMPSESESEFVQSAAPVDNSTSATPTPTPTPVKTAAPKKKTAKPVSEDEFIKPKYKSGVKPSKKAKPGKANVVPTKKPTTAKKSDGAENKPRAGQVVYGAHPNTLCNNPGAHIYEAWSGARIEQTTYYCWSETGYGVFYVGKGDLRGWTDTLRWAAQINWKGIDQQFTQCYPMNGKARGYCDQVTYGHYEQQLGPISPNINIWTQIRMYYNGYAECANAHDNRWTKCS